MERTTISVLCPPKRTFTMSQRVYKAIETTISRAEEIKTSAYIDDIYLQEDTKENCIKNIIDSVTLLRSLGFTVHAEKSQFLPTQELKILGFTINSVSMTV